MVCESNENLVVDINIELSTEHLNNVLGNHEVDGGDGLQKMCQAVNRTRVLRSSLLQRVGLFDRRLVDGIAGMTAKAEASTDDDELGAIVRSDHCDVVVKNSLDNHGTHHKNLLGKPDDRLFSSNRAGSMLTKSRVLRALAHDNEDRGIKAGSADRVEIDLDEGLARVDMVTLGNKRVEALALKLNSIDSDMQHHLSRAVVGHDAQRVLSRKQRRDGAGNRSAHRSLLGNHGNAIAHGTAAKSRVIGIFQMNKLAGNGSEDFELGSRSRLLIRTAHQARKETHGGMSLHKYSPTKINRMRPLRRTRSKTLVRPTSKGLGNLPHFFSLRLL